MRLSNSILLSLFYNMLRIQKVQLKIESLYHLDEMKTPVHLCLGQEAIAVGVCAHLHKDDYLMSNHRSHGHYLAKGGDLKKLIAELHCRETGCSRGRGGSMHLVDTSVGHLGSSSIVGGGIPIGTGLGLAISMKQTPQVSVIFFGDGAADEGVLYESVNFAILKRLPVIFLYENNQFSVCSHQSARQVGENIFHAASPELMYTQKVDGNAVLAVYEAAEKAVARARRGEGPSFIECKTYRVCSHAGAGTDAHLGFRAAAEIEAWKAKCPVTAFLQLLQSEGLMADADLAEYNRTIDTEIEAAFQFARQSPLPKREDLTRYLFREPN